MGGQCSSEDAKARRQSDAEEFALDPAPDRAAASCSGRGWCSGLDRSKSIDGCNVVETGAAVDVVVLSDADAPAAASEAERRLAAQGPLVGVADPVAGSDAQDGEQGAFYEEEDALRWAPAFPEAEEEMDPRRCIAMMAAMDHLIAPLHSSGGGESASSTSPARAEVRRPIGEEMQREAAFASLRDGRPLYSLPERFRADKEIVLAAIGAEGQYCYDYIASKELRERDRDVVAALVAEDGAILEHCCEELKADRQIVRIALKSCSDAIRWVPKDLQADKELKAIAAARAKEEQGLLKQLEAACTPAASTSRFWPVR